MSNKKLPSELVEKMDKYCLSILDGTILNPMQVAQLSDLISEQCAKISIDRVNEEAKVFRQVILGKDRIHDRLQEDNRVLKNSVTN